MQSTPLILSGVQLSADEFVAVNFRLWRARPRTRLNHWILGAAVMLLGVSVGLDVYSNSHLAQPSTAVLLGVAVLYAALRFGLVRYQLRRGYAKNTAAHHPTSFTLTQSEIIGRSTLGQFSGKWQVIRRAVWVQPHWLLLYPTEAACYYLDLRKLEAPAIPADVAALLEHHRIPQQLL
ncbi:hypothetical protein [Hymenobacter pini]|uniref:hypothetical protein n=1 Tax=Hymenobacter pini TaxID=2880879 RepID=UPI001CF50505|nr:hypothetical protein [Hymenobacter pini]MCA8829140.1 hypothetical protein [Hymenobacter pini]